MITVSISILHRILISSSEKIQRTAKRLGKDAKYSMLRDKPIEKKDDYEISRKNPLYEYGMEKSGNWLHLSTTVFGVVEANLPKDEV